MNVRIVVLGLGYVGLPLAVALARKYRVTGFDINYVRVSELSQGCDKTGEVPRAALQASSLRVTNDPAECFGNDIYIVTVPTPVDANRRPDLTAVKAATRQVAQWILPGSGAIVVYESTVYPGVTEDICGQIFADHGLRRGVDFKLAYSPERINPGDRVHTVDKITKVISAEDGESLATIEKMYGSITSGGVFKASSIKAAEASKAIENAQRDINVAFVNEIAKIAANVGVSVWDILEASKTKWNFLPFEPGLVGGHCIGVDPYYLSHLAETVGLHPQVILAGRETNDCMGYWVADQLHKKRGNRAGSVLLMGVTFKENVPDIRNSRVVDVAERLEQLGHSVVFTDCHADQDEVRAELRRDLVTLNGETYDLVIGAVPHDEYRTMGAEQIIKLAAPGGTIADLKAMWRDHRDQMGERYWSL